MPPCSKWDSATLRVVANVALRKAETRIMTCPVCRIGREGVPGCEIRARVWTSRDTRAGTSSDFGSHPPVCPRMAAIRISWEVKVNKYVDRSATGEILTPTLFAVCDVCRANTRRCEYYPPGRSRQHGKCLECERKDPRIQEGYGSTDPRYCVECDRIRRAEKP